MIKYVQYVGHNVQLLVSLVFGREGFLGSTPNSTYNPKVHLHENNYREEIR